MLTRNTTELVGRIYFDADNEASTRSKQEKHRLIALLEPLNRLIDHEILITDSSVALKQGQIAVARIVEQPTIHGIATVEVIDILGEHLTPEMEVEIALRNHDVPFEFPDRVIADADGLPFEIDRQQTAQREDLRHLAFVTIDGEDARDFDDAVYCEPRPSGGWRLFVAIADVAHYVTPGTPLDDEAYRRGTSVYFPQYVVPMLPEKLSNGICSLNPKVDRLVMVCEMTISGQGRVGSYVFYEGVIHSHSRLTYTQVARWIEQGRFPKHASYLEPLVALHDVLRERRAERGALDFDTTEKVFEFTEDGRIGKIKPATRNIAHTVIEECMLCANVSAARLLAKQSLAALYRVHPRPEIDKVNYLREFLTSFNVKLGGEDFPEPGDFRAAAMHLRDRPNSQTLQVAILRSMQKAVYQAENDGHFGLAYSHYTHFTSPIRRYPDLLVHRLIKSVIHSNKPCREVRRTGKSHRQQSGGGNSGQQQYYPYSEEQVLVQGEYLSFSERRADDVVYEVLEWVKCDYLSDHVGEDFDGVISGVTRFGLFVQLPALSIEGLVHVSALRHDYYHYEQGQQLLRGERTGQVFRLGDVVGIRVARVDVDERKIDFDLLTHMPTGSRQSQTARKHTAPENEARKSNIHKRKARKSKAYKSKARKSKARKKKSDQGKAGRYRHLRRKR